MPKKLPRADHPDVILADEPTGNLDSSSSREILDTLVSLNRSGRTVILITHDPSVAAVASRQCTMRDGHLHEAVTA